MRRVVVDGLVQVSVMVYREECRYYGRTDAAGDIRRWGPVADASDRTIAELCALARLVYRPPMPSE